MMSYKLMKGACHHVSNFCQNLNVARQNKCCGSVSCNISLFCKMQRGGSPSFELFQIDMYVCLITQSQISSFLSMKLKKYEVPGVSFVNCIEVIVIQKGNMLLREIFKPFIHIHCDSVMSVYFLKHKVWHPPTPLPQKEDTLNLWFQLQQSPDEISLIFVIPSCLFLIV